MGNWKENVKKEIHNVKKKFLRNLLSGFCDPAEKTTDKQTVKKKKIKGKKENY